MRDNLIELLQFIADNSSMSYGVDQSKIPPHLAQFISPLLKTKISFEDQRLSPIRYKKLGRATYWMLTRSGRSVIEGETPFPEHEETSQPSITTQELEEIVTTSVVSSLENKITFWLDPKYTAPYLNSKGLQSYASTWEKALESQKRGQEQGIITYLIQLSGHPYTLWQDPDFTKPYPVRKPDGKIIQAGSPDRDKAHLTAQAVKAFLGPPLWLTSAPQKMD